MVNRAKYGTVIYYYYNSIILDSVKMDIVAEKRYDILLL